MRVDVANAGQTPFGLGGAHLIACDDQDDVIYFGGSDEEPAEPLQPGDTGQLLWDTQDLVPGTASRIRVMLELDE